jgi:hypothetical protein
MEALPENSVRYLDDILSVDNLHIFAEKQQEQETDARNLLHNFEEEYDGVLNEDNLMEILSALHDREREEPMGKFAADENEDIEFEPSREDDDIDLGD